MKEFRWDRFTGEIAGDVLPVSRCLSLELEKIFSSRLIAPKISVMKGEESAPDLAVETSFNLANELAAEGGTAEVFDKELFTGKWTLIEEGREFKVGLFQIVGPMRGAGVTAFMEMVEGVATGVKRVLEFPTYVS